MDVPVIHVHVSSDKATVDYTRFMWETMCGLANIPNALRLSVHCIGPTAVNRLASLNNTKTYYVPNIDKEKGMSGATAHGACIEHALMFSDDGDIHINVDSDTVVLAKGWDDYVRLSLIDNNVGVIGPTFEDIGGFSSGTDKVQMFKDIPYTAWFAMSPLHGWRDLKVLPRKDLSPIPVNNEGLSKMYNLPVGYSVLRDVGWQIPEYLHSRNITYKGWKQLKGSKTAVVIKGLSDYHEEYHVEENIPFLVHQRGSLSHKYRDGVSAKFYNAVDTYLIEEKKREPRWNWAFGPHNDVKLQSLLATKARSTDRITALEKMAGVIQDTGAKELPARVYNSEPVSTPVGKPGNDDKVEGWLKGTMDGTGVWNRYAPFVPSTINVTFTPEFNAVRNLRLEGTVSNINVTLPDAPLKPYLMIVRNLTAGSVTLKSEGARTVELPKDACWQVVVDVDGVVHVQ